MNKFDVVEFIKLVEELKKNNYEVFKIMLILLTNSKQINK